MSDRFTLVDGERAVELAARVAGATVVMDRCIMVDHARLLGRAWRCPN